MLTLFGLGFFCLLVAGGEGAQRPPPCNYKTAHGMVSNMSQNNVLVISNVQAFLD